MPGDGLRGPSAAPDQLGQRRHGSLTGNVEAAAEIVPERDALFGAGLEQPEEGIATIPPDIAAGAAANFFLCDVAPDFALGAVRMEGDLRAIEHGQQFRLVGPLPCQQAIEGDEPGAAFEDPIEAGTQLAATARRRVKAVRFQVGVEIPDQRSDTLLADALLLGESVELIDKPLRMRGPVSPGPAARNLRSL